VPVSSRHTQQDLFDLRKKLIHPEPEQAPRAREHLFKKIQTFCGDNRVKAERRGKKAGGYEYPFGKGFPARLIGKE